MAFLLAERDMDIDSGHFFFFNRKGRLICVYLRLKSALICEKLSENFSQIYADQGADYRRLPQIFFIRHKINIFNLAELNLNFDTHEKARIHP
jgi:hypothetical protein